MSELFKIFLVFAKIGAVTFGGGYAMLPILERELVENRNWTTRDELLDYFAVGQCVPGVIAVNSATFIGYNRMGVIGGITAAAGVVFPSLVIILILAASIQNFTDYPVVIKAFEGINAVVAAIIIRAVVSFFKSGVKDIVGAVIFVLAFFISGIFNISAVYVVIGSIIVGLIAGKFGRCKE